MRQLAAPAAAAVAPTASRRSRWLTISGLVAIGVLSAAALVWPALPWNANSEVPIRAGVVLRTLDEPRALARIGHVAPGFEWVAPSGETRRLSDLRGRAVVINFWATWCEPCRREMPALDRAAADDPSVAVLALDLDESADKVDAFLESYGIDRLVPIIDAGKRVALRYDVLSLPSTFFVAPDGVVRHIEIRGMDDAAIRAGLAKAR